MGAIKGFRYLNFEQALARFATAEPYVLASYLEEHPEVCFVDLRKRTKEEEGGEEEVKMEVTFEEGSGCKALATRTWASGEVLLRGIKLPEHQPQQQQQEPEVEKQHAFIVVLAPGVARGLASIDLTGLRGAEEEEGREDEEKEETWPLRFLFSGDRRRKTGENKANVRVEKEGGREGGEEGEGKTYKVVATAAIAVGQPLVVEGGKGEGGSV